MIVFRNLMTQQLYCAADEKSALVAAVRLNKADEEHPLFGFYELDGSESELSYIGRLERPFGSSNFYINKEISL